jgi:PEP-CTERM motif
MKKFGFLAGAVVAGLLSATPASAAIFTYSISGNGVGSLDGVGYSGAFTISGSGDNSIDLNPSPIVTAYRIDNLTVTFGSTVLSAVFPIAFFTQNVNGAAGFVQIAPPFAPPFIIQDVFDVLNPIFQTYDPTTPLGPTSVNFFVAPFALATDGGFLSVIGRPTDLVFTAGPANTPAVPEPASWAMMIAGFGIAGAAMRRKASVKVSYS